MKWTENNITFEGTVEEYLALKKANLPAPAPDYLQPKFKRTGHPVTVIDLGGDEHKFVRVADAAKYISISAQRRISASNLSKRTSDTLYLKDYMSCNAPWNPHQENLNDKELANV